MMQILKATNAPTGPAIAVPALRVCAVLSGTFTAPGNMVMVSGILDAFLRAASNDVAYVVTSKGGRAPARLQTATPAKIDAIRAAIADGFAGLTGFRLYGPDDNPMRVPGLPFLSVTEYHKHHISIEVAVDADSTDRASFLAETDAALRHGAVLAGYQGFGFFKSPLSKANDSALPPAHHRLRVATLGEWGAGNPLVVWDKVWDAKLGGYAPGLSDMNWRTYVGSEFVARTKDALATLPAGIRVENTGPTTVVTIGTAPIWGDLNTGEDITAYRQAYAALKPAFCSQVMLRLKTLGGIQYQRTQADGADKVESYMNRFVPEDEG